MHNFSKLFKITLVFSVVIFTSNIKQSYADIVDTKGTRWPVPDWNVEKNFNANMSGKQCTDFVNFSNGQKDFLTEGLVVIKDGSLQYENYDNTYNKNTPHALWSITKTITGALLGIAVREGKISLDQNLNEFYPRPNALKNYKDIKIKNLFYLDTGFIWNEFYSGDVRSSPVVNMLYGNGHSDIMAYAANKEIIQEGPGQVWNYSTGTPAITMGVLKKVYGEEYDHFPWTALFKPLGMSNISFERDAKGVFNGGSSVFATPREMAKFGYLYLNNGKWQDKEILSEDWIKKTLQVSPGYLAKGTVVHNITDDGVFGGSIWLNRPAKNGFGKPYPTSPEDMFLARGHHGQLIIVLPTQKMVIARTGFDHEYNSKIDEFVSRAISCFADPSFPIGKNIPPPKDGQSFYSSTLDTIETLKSGIQSNIIQSAVAKSVCSCHFISGLDVKICIGRRKIPAASLLTSISVENNTVNVLPTILTKILGNIFGQYKDTQIVASFNQGHPEFGCTLK